MLMSWIWTGMIAVSLLAAVLTGNGAGISAAVGEGAEQGIRLCIALAGSMCLWTGVGKLMERAGFTGLLARLIRPALTRLFPTCKHDQILSGQLSANICANLLGLGNAATPMGIQAAKRLAQYGKPGIASNELCTLVVLNTASIQLIPTTVAAIRTSLGCNTPYDILPAVWITSVCSAVFGLLAAWILGKLL